jgi:hypothetical protein
LIALLLAAVTLVNFYRPLQIHFWGGADDHLSFEEKPLFAWMASWDREMNRPFTVLPCVVGQLLIPGRVEGFLWLGVALCWVNGLLLFAIVVCVLPRARLLAVAAAVLLIVDRSDPARFFVMWCANHYLMALAFLLFGVWLFLLSYHRDSRWLLALSCASLGASLLLIESAYPLAVLVPVLAWFGREHRQRLPVWAYTWVGTLCLFAVRFLLFLKHRGPDAYQAGQLTGVLHDPGTLLGHLQLHLAAGLTNFQMSGSVGQTWRAAGATLVLVVLVVGFAAWRTTERAGLRRYLILTSVALLALLAGMAPSLPMPYVFRTEFFSGPGRAVLLAGLLCLMGNLMGRRLAGATLTLAVGLLAANSTVEAISAQRHARSQSRINFERTVHIFRQIHGICPNPLPDTLILLVPDFESLLLPQGGKALDYSCAPLGTNYGCLAMAEHLLGTRMVQAGIGGGLPPPVLGADSVSVSRPGRPGVKAETRYDKVLAFRAGTDGSVTLLRRLPAKLLPPANALASYQPLALLRSGAVAELPYLRYPAWATRPRDLFDMADGVLLGQGWGALECHGGELSRLASDGAELLVNSMGNTSRELRLQIEAGGVGRLEALDVNDRVVASEALDGRREVRLTVPTNPEWVTLIRLRAFVGTASATFWRVFCPGGKAGKFQPPPPSDIINDDLALGGNWHDLEVADGQSFRWVTDDAEIIIGIPPVGRVCLVLQVAPGPGHGVRPCPVTLRDSNDRELARASIDRPQEIKVVLPAETKAGSVIRLHVESPGQPTPTDSRILNFRVLRCELLRSVTDQ